MKNSCVAQDRTVYVVTAAVQIPICVCGNTVNSFGTKNNSIPLAITASRLSGFTVRPTNLFCNDYSVGVELWSHAFCIRYSLRHQPRSMKHMFLICTGIHSNCINNKHIGYPHKMASGHSTVTPSCNRLLEKKWDERKLQQHREKVGGACMLLNKLCRWRVFFVAF